MALESRSAAARLALGLAFGLVLGLTLLAGCARPTLKVGPEAARLTVDFAAQVPPGKVNSYDLWKQGGVTLRSRFRSTYGPFWRLRAVTLDPEGKEVDLPPGPGQKTGSVLGREVAGQRVFLITPGDHKVRLTLCAEMRLLWQERISTGRGYYTQDARGRMVREYEEPIWQERSRIVTLTCYEREITLTAPPGGEIALEFKPGAAPPAGKSR